MHTKQNELKMITRENFKDVIESINLSELPQEMNEAVEQIKILTTGFTDWSIIDSDKDLSEVVSLVIEKINGRTKAEKHEEPLPAMEAIIEVPKSEIIPGPDRKPKKERKKKETKPKKEKPAYSGEYVENVIPEIRIIKRYVAMDGKTMTKEKILTFISTLQKLIRSHAIRKTSKYAYEITHIEKELVKTWNKHKESRAGFLFELDGSDKKVKEAYKAIGTSQKPMESIKLIKRFLSIQGKSDVKEKAKQIKYDIGMKTNSGDKYQKELTDVVASLRNYLEGRTDVPELTEQQLNGLTGLGLIDYNHDLKKGDTVYTYAGIKGKIKKVLKDSVVIDTTPGHYYNKKKVRKEEEPLNGCGTCSKEKGLGIINANDLKEMQFQPVGYKEKWLILIGDPVEPFGMMIWSRPGLGKSSLMIEFAYYLASAHNKKVLFVSKEEGIGYTLKDKFIRMNAFHPNIDISPDQIPDDLSIYDYVMIDSINAFHLNHADIKALKEKFPKVSFVYIFQATVDGNYRGSKDFEHLVDVSININENGFAKAQKSRFGGMGSINVFSENIEKVYKFTNLQEAEKFKGKKLEEGIQMKIMGGDDGKIWVVEEENAVKLQSQGFEIL